MFQRTPHRVLLTLLLLNFFGCRREDITTVRVPKEPPRSASSADRSAPAKSMGPSSMGPDSSGLAAAGTRKDIQWTVPKGWQENAPTSMRVGSFLVKSDNGESVDVSVVPLAGDVGGLAANVNRWRGQIGLGPLSETELAQQVSHPRFSGREMTWTDFANGGTRLTAAIYPQGQRLWFFKMMGPDALVQKSHTSFKAFLSSLRFTSSTHE